MNRIRSALTALPKQTVAHKSAQTTSSDTRQIIINFDYHLVFTQGVFQPANRTLVDAIRRKEVNRRHQLICYVDSGALASNPELLTDIRAYVDAHSSRLLMLDEPTCITGGEKGKTKVTVDKIQQHMLSVDIDRQSVVIAIGGGAALDTIGYAAATYHRGIRLVRLPTTVLGQNDAGVGVKNGINAYGVKNLLGSFAPPFAVINDSEFLQSLSLRDQRSGIAEAVKVAALRDCAFFAWIEANTMALKSPHPPAMNYLIQRCAELHIEQIVEGGDPFEMGSARPLDYGHWSAHKLESLSRYEIRHGEAVAIGMALDALYAANIGLLDRAEADRLLSLLITLGFDLYHPALEIENHKRAKRPACRPGRISPTFGRRYVHHAINVHWREH